MKVLTWNIQATKGCDGRFDAERIIDQIKEFGDLDVICLQEVAKNIPSLNANDQVALLSDQFAGFEAVWAPGFSVPDSIGSRCEFGNLTLVKQPLLENARTHILASPAVDEQQIPRTMAEVVINARYQDIAIFNTHLAFHSRDEQIAQIQNITHLRDQLISKADKPGSAQSTGPFYYTDSVKAVLLCGDLNINSESDDFKSHIVDQGWIDCWNVQQSSSATGQKRQPTCGCYDQVQWPEGAHVRDYFLATENIASKTISVMVDLDTSASDHQPVLLEIEL